MNELRHYIKLVRKTEVPGVYTEKHHIFPRAIYGDNPRVVHLTAREHYVAHLLLWKICQKRYGVGHHNTLKMAKAFVMMCDTQYKTSHLYEEAKLSAMEYNRQVQTGRKHSEESKVKRRVKMTGRVVSKATRDRLGKSRKGLRYWNDGTNNKMCKVCPGEGWVPGQLKRSGFKRKPHTEAAKRKMSDQAKKRTIRRNNMGQFVR